jgi:hypothetical protein
MTTTSTVPAVPQALAERFVQAFAAFVQEVWLAVTTHVPDPAIANTPAFLAWQTRALPRLERENAAIQNAMTLFLVGEVRTLVNLARESRALAKKLDGFDLNFAGAETAGKLDQLETAVVVAAYLLCVAAGVP